MRFLPSNIPVYLFVCVGVTEPKYWCMDLMVDFDALAASCSKLISSTLSTGTKGGSVSIAEEEPSEPVPVGGAGSVVVSAVVVPKSCPMSIDSIVSGGVSSTSGRPKRVYLTLRRIAVGRPNL